MSNAIARKPYTAEQERELSDKSRLILAALRNTTQHRRGHLFLEPFGDPLFVTIGEGHDFNPDNEKYRDFIYVWIHLADGGLLMGLDDPENNFEKTLLRLMQDANINYLVPALEEYRMENGEIMRTPGVPDTRSNFEMAELESARLQAEKDAAEDNQRWADDGGN